MVKSFLPHNYSLKLASTDCFPIYYSPWLRGTPALSYEEAALREKNISILDNDSSKGHLRKKIETGKEKAWKATKGVIIATGPWYEFWIVGIWYEFLEGFSLGGSLVTSSRNTGSLQTM